MKFPNIELLHKMIAQGYVSKRDHPCMPLSIYKYTAKAQYERVWNEVTLNMRGVVLDSDYNYVTRPFSKFFNYTEPEAFNNRPDLPFEVYPKLDGSLICVTTYNGTLLVTSSGSFESEQVRWAQQILLDKKIKFIHNTTFTNKTFLFELIHPSNKIVVDYGSETELCLLSVLDNETHYEETWKYTEWARDKDILLVVPIHHMYTRDPNYLAELQAKNVKNEEGYVIAYSNGFREKVKFSDYVEQHKVNTQLTTKTVYKYWLDNTSMEEFLNPVPDEFYPWIKGVWTGLEEEANQIFKVVTEFMETACSNISMSSLTREERKEIALKIQNANIPKQYQKYCFMSLKEGVDDTKLMHFIKSHLEPAYTQVEAIGGEAVPATIDRQEAHVIFTVGLPASGKTTWAHEFVNNTENDYFNFNLDDLRKMSGAGKLPTFTKKREGVVYASMKNGIYQALSRGYNVVVSNTNLDPKTVRDLQLHCSRIEGVDVHFFFKSFLHVSYATCLERNSLRTGGEYVPTEAMERMNNFINN